MPDDDHPDLFSQVSAPRRLFLDWDRPLLERAAEWLLEQAEDAPVLDLSDLLVIVPTRNAGRRLREMLANLADERDTAVVPPLVAPTSLLLRPEVGAAELGRPIAGDLEALAAWIAVLLEISLDHSRSLFPLDPPQRDFAWARGHARDFARLKADLGESGLTFSEVARRLPPEHDERDRWADLARLEDAWLDRLESLGRCDREIARTIASRKASLPEGTRSVVLMATPDPLPLAVDALENLAASGTPVTVAIYAPGSLADTFDAWGRPSAEAWQTMPIDLPDFFTQVEIVATPDSLIERVSEMASAVSDPAETLAIGAIDPELAPLLECALLGRGISAFNPEGRRLRQEGFLSLLETLGALIQQPTFEVVRELLRFREVEIYLLRKLGAWKSRTALRALDESRGAHLAATLPELVSFLRQDAAEFATSPREWERERAPEFSMTAEGLAELGAVGQGLSRGSLSDTLPPLLREWTGARRHAPGDWGEKVLETAAAPLMDALGQLESIREFGISLNPTEQFTLLVDHLSQLGISEDRPSRAIELQGWLELPWEDAPHLVVAGMNDGLVPGAIVGDAFLPESLRRLRSLRLKTNDDRLVRDLYLLRTLVESRRESGRLDLLVPKTTADGDPLQPSRLLFRCCDEDLPSRVSHLFQEVEIPGSQASWSPGFQLVPGLPREGSLPWEPKRIAVTAFAVYLESPFHFWTGRIARMSSVDADKAEMDDLDFGNFCHLVLERYGQDPQARTWTESDKIETFLLEAANELATAIYGPHPCLAIRIQLDAARRRLAEAARHEARQRADGWEIIGAEVKLADTYPLVIEGIEISGSIDRIERRGDSLRLLDFKTSDKKQNSLRDHLVGTNASTPAYWPPDYARFDHTDFFSRAADPAEKSYRFKKLQLPLYALAVSQAEPEMEIRCGYFHLAKAVADIGPDDWVADAELLAATKSCAAGVIADLKAGRFGLLRANPRYDDLVSLHLGVPERTLDLTHVGGGDDSPRGS